MLDEIFKSIKAQLYERAVSPLMGSIIISWVIWNYKFVLLVFANIQVVEKYRIIDEVIFSSWQQIYLQGVLYPILTSLAYLFIYPYPAKYVFEFSKNRQKEISDIKKKIEEETLLTVKESQSIRREIYRIQEEFQNDISRKDSEIERLKLQIEEMYTKNPEVISEPTNQAQINTPITDIELSESQIKTLLAIVNNQGETAESRLVLGTPNNQVEVKYNLGELEKQGYLQRKFSQNQGDYTYDLTHKARSYLVKYKHV